MGFLQSNLVAEALGPRQLIELYDSGQKTLLPPSASSAAEVIQRAFRRIKLEEYKFG